MNPLLLKVHRWTALVFALPLLFVLGTGLILSIEPSLVVGAIKPGSIDAAKIEAMLAKHDPKGQARAVVYRSYENTLAMGGGRGGGTSVDMATGELAKSPGWLSDLLVTARRMHETLLIDAGWLVTASTVAMLVLASLGVAMGLPRFTNSVPGWHKATAWLLLPLVVLSPLTGLFLVAGLTFAGPPPPEARTDKPVALAEAVRIVGKQHDLSGLVWLRPQGGRMLARVVEGGEYRTYAVTPNGMVAMPRNWPRLWHEGNFAGHVSAALNLITSFALVGLLSTGLWIWGSSQVRIISRQRAREQQAAAE